MDSAWIRGLTVAALLALSAGEARAAQCRPLTSSAGQILSPCIDADNLWPHAGGGPYFAIGTTTTAPAGSLGFGLVGSFLSQPIGVGVASADPSRSSVPSIDAAFDATLLLALGVTDRLELTLAAPATLYQSGPGLTTVSSAASPLLRSAPRDMRFGFSLALLRRPRAGPETGPALTGRLEFAAPTGSEVAFAGGRTAVIAPSLVFSYRIGRVDVSAEAFARLRGETTFATAVVGPQVGGALGASVDILKERWLGAGAEVFALYTTSRQLPDPSDTTGATPPPLVPGEWIAHVSTAHFFGGDLTVSLGGGSSIPFASHGAFTSPRYRLDFALRYAPTGRDTDGDGVLDRDDHCPTERGSRSNHGCPVEPPGPDESPAAAAPEPPAGPPPAEKPAVAEAVKDTDGDGIPDAQDACPEEREDFDGFQDHDGCPEPDNDQDGVPDADDRCPNEAETIDGFQDADGCPEPGAVSAVRWEGDRVVLVAPAKGAAAPVRFAPGRAEPPAALEQKLRLMAQLARGRAPLGAVIVEAYADRQGDTSIRALELAAARAEAVKKIFAAAGVPVALITAAAGDPMAKRAPTAMPVDVTVSRRPRPRKPMANPPPQSPR